MAETLEMNGAALEEVQIKRTGGNPYMRSPSSDTWEKEPEWLMEKLIRSIIKPMEGLSKETWLEIAAKTWEYMENEPAREQQQKVQQTLSELKALQETNPDLYKIIVDSLSQDDTGKGSKKTK